MKGYHFHDNESQNLRNSPKDNWSEPRCPQC